MSAPVYEELGQLCPRCHKRMTVERDHDGADQACLSCGHTEAGPPAGRPWTPTEIRNRHAKVRRQLNGAPQGVQLPIVWDDDLNPSLVSMSGTVSVTAEGVEWSAACYRCGKPYEDCGCVLMPDRRPVEVS